MTMTMVITVCVWLLQERAGVPLSHDAAAAAVGDEIDVDWQSQHSQSQHPRRKRAAGDNTALVCPVEMSATLKRYSSS